jgi:hypothetical protein
VPITFRVELELASSIAGGPEADLVNQTFSRKLKESLEGNFSEMGELISATLASR